MPEDLNTLGGIVGIEPPLPPPLSGWQLALLGVMAAGLVCAILYLVWRRYSSVRGRARRRLAGLRDQYGAQHLDSHRTAFQLAAILRAGLGVRRLSADTPLPATLATEQARWQGFVAQLSQARYTPTGVDAAQMTALFQQATFWLRHWP